MAYFYFRFGKNFLLEIAKLDVNNIQTVFDVKLVNIRIAEENHFQTNVTLFLYIFVFLLHLTLPDLCLLISTDYEWQCHKEKKIKICRKIKLQNP